MLTRLLTLRATVIGGKKWPDDYSAACPLAGSCSLPASLRTRWICNFYDKPGGGSSGSGDDLEDCKRQFREAWATLRAGLSEEDMAFEMRR